MVCLHMATWGSRHAYKLLKRQISPTLNQSLRFSTSSTNCVQIFAIPPTTSLPSAKNMVGRHSRSCPLFDTHDGVCGCPEFWKTMRQSQTEPAPSLQEVANTRHGGLSSNVNSMPPTNATKNQFGSPAPPGPPKETCFFWYHGTCRRGEACDRPHQLHPTWPIPPPPGFRHFQPCKLPLCPLREDLEAANKAQENQHLRRRMGGQVDGDATSRETTTGR
ncbi:hypothetical protein C7974DRAFT_31522 [Boeremia exigua]|uniref:uncharacterized protein n=1 Tax=Boeremia exigua TaxID=749465 RepID=UPI001E8E4B89|nr:uncharacterized protein C7974DRAFT_31522 [Boeremia exigua]KAH6618518.1 hypothetical protein C7974DRAFT_31522 [Boeremia exigua]